MSDGSLFSLPPVTLAACIAFGVVFLVALECRGYSLWTQATRQRTGLLLAAYAALSVVVAGAVAVP